MKKLTGILIAVLVAFSACTKVERDPMPAGKIAFTVGNYAHRTKADPDTLGFSTISTSFRSRAFLHAAGVNSVQHFFGEGSGERVAYDSVNNIWAPGADTGFEYYWPLSSDSHINFVCWYDKNGAPDTLAISETSLGWSARTIVADDDILYADEAWHYNDNENGRFEASEGVPVLFHHALAQLGFRARIADGCAADGDIHWEVGLVNVSLEGVYHTGTLSLVNSEPAGTSPATRAWDVVDDTWTSLTDRDSISIVGSTPVILDSLYHLDTLMLARTVLPQTVSNDVVLRLTYQIRTFYGESNAPYSVEHIDFSGRMIDLVPSIDTWEMSHRIMYTLSIDPKTQTILLSPTLSDWNPIAGGGDITIQ